MAFIRKVKTKSGATAVQIIHKNYGQVTRLEHVGSAHNPTDLSTLLALARSRLQSTQQSFFPDTAPSVNIQLKQTCSGLLWRVLLRQYEKLGFNQLSDDVFAALIIARMVEPTSKIDSLRVLADLGISFDKNHLYRCLRKVIDSDYRSAISQLCFNHASGNGLSLLLYDVTTLYFEVQQEDEFRKPGMSKERRLEPQIIIGMLVDRTGFPLGLHSFKGNTAETRTMMPVIKDFCAQHGMTNRLTVVADAAMLSADNLSALTEAGFTYIVGSRIHKIPYEIAHYQKTQPLSDKQIVVSEYPEYRIIYQYREKRAAVDRRNIQKQIDKAQKIITGQAAATRVKFLTLKDKNKHLNQTLVDKAYSLAGIKGYITNLDIPDQQVIDYYHQLFQVEASFRMAKSDLKARPVFHRKRDSIEAHLTIVLAALALGRYIEAQTGIGIKLFVRTLRPVRTGVVVINGQEYPANEIVPELVQQLLQKLGSGH